MPFANSANLYLYCITIWINTAKNHLCRCLLTNWIGLCLILLLLPTSGCAPPHAPLGDYQIRYHADLAERWLVNNLNKSNLFNYAYYANQDRYSSNNNAIRQLMSSRVLASMVQTKKAYLPDHERNLSHLMAAWYREEGDLAYVWFKNQSKLGANALLLRTLVASPFFDLYTDQANKLARGILSLASPEGELRAFYRTSRSDYDEERLLKFYSGEALLALLEYATAVDDQNWIREAQRIQEFYLQQYVTNIRENYYPAYVPWHTLSLHQLFLITNDVRYPKAVFILTDRLLTMMDTDLFPGRFYNDATPEFGSPHAASDGVYTEGLLYALELAHLAGDERRVRRYRAAARLALENLYSLQFQRHNIAGFSQPERALGGIRSRHNSSSIRIDSVQHTLDALHKAIQLQEQLLL